MNRLIAVQIFQRSKNMLAFEVYLIKKENRKIKDAIKETLYSSQFETIIGISILFISNFYLDQFNSCTIKHLQKIGHRHRKNDNETGFLHL